MRNVACGFESDFWGEGRGRSGEESALQEEAILEGHISRRGFVFQAGGERCDSEIRKDLRWTGWEHARGAEAALCSAFSSPHGKFTGQIQDSTNSPRRNVSSRSKTPQTGPPPPPLLAPLVLPSAASVTLSDVGSSPHLQPVTQRARSVHFFFFSTAFLP